MKEEDRTRESNDDVKQYPETLKQGKAKRLREYEDNNPAAAAKHRKIGKGAFIASNTPSYCLKQGFGTSFQRDGGESLRSEHRKRLWRLLNKLMKRQNWAEASGVLSVLLQATVNDKSASRNRVKYSAALELLSHINGESISSERSSSFYNLWLKKIGHRKNWAPKNKFAVKLESIIFSLQHALQHGITDGTSYGKIKKLTFIRMIDYRLENYPLSDFVRGLMLYHLWYYFRSKGSFETSMQSEMPTDGIHESFGNSRENDAHEERGANSSTEMPTDGIHESFGNSRENDAHEERGANSSTTVHIDSNTFVDNLSKETSQPSFQSQETHMHGYNDNSFSNYSGDFPPASIFDTRGMPPSWLLPLKPDSHENLEVDDKSDLQNKYELALKHLHVALHSTPPVNEAFHPLIQMMLLNDQVDEALKELENLSHSSATVLQLRLKANVLEHFDVGNYLELSTCFDDILKKDPTCRDSLAKLVILHQHGYYDTQNLTDMLATHLDATYGTRDTWKELASCFLKLSLCEEDRGSICCDATYHYSREDVDNSNKIPELFINGKSVWKSRCKWWLDRYFHNDILLSDIASGDLELLTYKASTASYLYGRRFRYVFKVTECIEKEDNMELYSFLQMHINNSIGFYSI
ncbi:hypothetical protein ACJIZ3_005965 [Penstemon smallii]|uniref:Uncharacterized protein n=1 Tax=Penstemon smallii TaxID=265156 RepID=A0ABD3S6M3_9LAMI